MLEDNRTAREGSAGATWGIGAQGREISTLYGVIHTPYYTTYTTIPR